MAIQSVCSGPTRLLVRPSECSTSSCTSPEADKRGSVETKVSISSEARLLRRLADLKRTDPDQARTELASALDTLRAQARSASDTEAAQLNALAGQLQAAAGG